MKLYLLIVMLSAGGVQENRIIDQTLAESECHIWRDSLAASGIESICAVREIHQPIKEGI